MAETTNSSSVYIGSQIELDLDKMWFKRDSDKNWMRLPKPRYIVLTQRKMSQRGGIRASSMSHSYNAFCAYIKAGDLNIRAFQGRRDLVEEEAQKLSKFLEVGIKDLFPRDKEGNVIDDDYKSFDIGFIWPVIIVVVVLIMLFSLF